MTSMFINILFLLPNLNQQTDSSILKDILEICGTLKENERLVLSSKYDCTFCRDGVYQYVENTGEKFKYKIIFLGDMKDFPSEHLGLLKDVYFTNKFQLFSAITQKYKIEKFPIIFDIKADELTLIKI